MWNLNDGNNNPRKEDIKCFVIALKDSLRRRESIEQQLKTLGVEFEFFDAVDTRKSEESFEPHKRPGRCCLRGGALGCALSHVFCYLEILKRDSDIALILEDDAVLPKNLKSKLQEIATFLETRTGKPTVVQLTYSNLYLKAVYHKLKENTLHRALNATGTVAYVLNKKAAEELAKFLYPVYKEADCWGWLVDHGVVDVFAIEQPLVKIYDGDSTIDHANAHDLEMDRMIKSERPLLAKIKHMIWSSKPIRKLFCKVNKCQPEFTTDDFSD